VIGQGDGEIGTDEDLDEIGAAASVGAERALLAEDRAGAVGLAITVLSKAARSRAGSTSATAPATVRRARNSRGKGHNDADPACGRGWATLGTAGRLVGRLFLHNSDDSPFVAERE
jgi:hypothetical protein